MTKAARRYATALLELAKEMDIVDSVLEDVNLIRNTLGDSDELVNFLKSPIIKFDDKSEALDKIFGERVADLTGEFMSLLTRKERINLLDQIAEAFIQQYNVYAGILEVDVYTATELKDTQREDLLKALEAKTGKEVHIHHNLDESLQGGMAVRINDTVIDGTIKHQLEELEQKFLSTPIE